MTSSDAFGLASWQALPAVTNYWSLGTNGTDIYNTTIATKATSHRRRVQWIINFKNTNSNQPFSNPNYANTGLIEIYNLTKLMIHGNLKNYANGAITLV